MRAAIIMFVFSTLLAIVYCTTHSMAWHSFWKKARNDRAGTWWDWRWNTRRAA